MSLFVWITFANPVYEPSRYCTKLKNTEVDSYRVVIEKDDGEWWIYMPNPGECISNISGDVTFFWTTWMRVLLLDKSFDIEEVTREFIDNNAIYLRTIWVDDCYIFDCTETKIYDIVRENGTYKLILDKDTLKTRWKVDFWLKQFPKLLLFAILIETLNLFIVVKIFRKEEKISIKKLLLFWILPTVITLPVLWFILSLLKDLSRSRYICSICIWELLVILVESIVLKYWLTVSWKKALIVSIIWNFCSFFIPLFFLIFREL